MGMYTEFFARGEIRKDAPIQVKDIVRSLTYKDDWDGDLPDHELFSCPRWESLGSSQSPYFPVHARSIVTTPTVAGPVQFTLHSDLKNYGGVVQKFFDWIDPYLYAVPGDFIGFSLHEEADEPMLYFKK